MCGRGDGGRSGGGGGVMDRPTRTVVYMKKQLRKNHSAHARAYRRRRKVVNHS